ncbi:MAG TPA: ATP-binding protein [Polyangia bacterium]|nr:ATP-binding protein [Polyangia bacterium]
MSVRKQLRLGFAALMGVTLTIGAISIGALWASVVSSDQQAQAMDRLATVERLRYHAEQVVSASRGFLLVPNQRSSASFEEAKQRFIERLRELQSLLPKTDGQFLQAVGQAADNYVSDAERTMRERGAQGDTESAVVSFDAVMRPAREQLEAALDQLVRDERLSYRSVAAASERADWLAAIVIGGATMLAILISRRLALTTTQRIGQQFEREQEAREAAKRASAAREELLAIVSHDLRNPLGAILMGTEALKRKSLSGGISGRQVNVIENAARRMKHLIEDVLATASLEAGTFSLSPAREDVASLFNETATLFERAAEGRGIRLSFSAAAGVTAYVDRERLLQVLSNLVGNALKFTPEGGEILVSATSEPGCTRFCVKDSGPGIPADAVPRLFERHWQAQRGSGGGLGLGLYIARHVVDRHGGHIDVASRPGEGATFTFTIPEPAPGTLPRPSEGKSPQATPPALH